MLSEHGCLGLLKWYNPKDIMYRPRRGPLSSNILWAQKAGKGQLGLAPLSTGSFLLIYLFQVPFCYLGWKFHTCSAQRNAALAGQRASQEMRSNFAFVASFHCGFFSHSCEADCASAWAVHQPHPTGEQPLSGHLVQGTSADIYEQPGSWPLKAQRPFICHGI